MTTSWRVGATTARVGERRGFARPAVDEQGPVRVASVERVRVMAVETAHILVEFLDLPEAGTGARRWMSHDAFAMGATPPEIADLTRLRVQRHALLEALVAINQKYEFGRIPERSPEDQERFAGVLAELNQLDDDYDRAYPLPPCTACGATIRASLLHLDPSPYPCPRVGECPNAPSALGG